MKRFSSRLGYPVFEFLLIAVILIGVAAAVLLPFLNRMRSLITESIL